MNSFIKKILLLFFLMNITNLSAFTIPKISNKTKDNICCKERDEIQKFYDELVERYKIILTDNSKLKKDNQKLKNELTKEISKYNQLVISSKKYQEDKKILIYILSGILLVTIIFFMIFIFNLLNRIKNRDSEIDRLNRALQDISNISSKDESQNSQNRFFIVDGSSIKFFNESGALIKKIILSENIKYAKEKDGEVYVETEGGIKKIYSITGKFLRDIK